jgi:hypothetical protein
MKLWHSLGDEPEGSGGVLRAVFLAGALQELSFGLIRWNFSLHRASVACLLGLSEIAFRLA